MQFQFGFLSKETPAMTNVSDENASIGFPDVLKTLADISSFGQERRLMAIAMQKFESGVEIITSKLQPADDDRKLQMSSTLGLLWNNLRDFQLLSKRVKGMNGDNEAVVISIVDTYYDFLMEHKEYIRRLPMEKRVDLAKLTYECLASAQNERAELLIVMNLMQHEASKRFKFSEQVESCLNQNADLKEVIDKGVQMMAAESENLKIIKKKLEAMHYNRTSTHTIKANYPRKLADWLKQTFHRRNRDGFQQLYYFIYTFLPNILKNIRKQFNTLHCKRF